MGLKIICDGAFGSGKTAFTATMAEVGPIGVCDTEQRWQYYTTPHPAVTPRTEPPAGLIEGIIGPKPPEQPASAYAAMLKAWRGVYAQAYAHPRSIRKDVAWLPKTDNVVWLLQNMDPIAAWNVTRIWAADPPIVGIAKDSASVYWDILQDLKDPDEKLGGLAWAPIKRTDRRMMYTLLKSEKHWILVAHTQEKMNQKMEVIARVPWVEKKSPHWADLLLRFNRRPGEAPKVEVVAEKIAGGKAGALALGKTLQAPTFKAVLELAGAQALVEPATQTMEQIEARTRAAIGRVRDSAFQPGVDSDPKGE